MGQPIAVSERASVANPGLVRFETNRALSGMGHERWRADDVVSGDRPVDELARRMFARGGLEAIHMNGSVVTVDLAKGCDAVGLKEIIETLYVYYPPDDQTAAPDGPAGESTVAESTVDESTGADADVVAEAGDAPESATDPATATEATSDDAPASDMADADEPPSEGIATSEQPPPRDQAGS